MDQPFQKDMIQPFKEMFGLRKVQPGRIMFAAKCGFFLTKNTLQKTNMEPEK